jgi:hypothetical protein
MRQIGSHTHLRIILERSVALILSIAITTTLTLAMSVTSRSIPAEQHSSTRTAAHLAIVQDPRNMTSVQAGWSNCVAAA